MTSLTGFITRAGRIQRDQWLPRERMENLQWQRFRLILTHAYHNSPFYHKRLKAAGIHPVEIRNREDIGCLPVTHREDLRNPTEMIASGFASSYLKRSTTSGSTGERTTTYFDSSAWLTGKHLLKYRARLACGLRPWDRVALCTEADHHHNFIKSLLLRHRSFCAPHPLETLIKPLENYHPSVLYGFPSFFSLLVDSKVNLLPRLIFTSSEILDIKTRRKIENYFGSPVYDVYGSTELKEIAWECPRREGYHINSDWFFVEFLEGGRSGQQGEILVTSLYNYAMPLIRYAVGDTGRLLNHNCSCGRGLPLMEPLHGRSVDYFTLPDGALVSPYTMTCAIENLEGMKQYQIHQIRTDTVWVNVIPDAMFNDDVRSRLKSILEDLLPRVSVQVKIVSSIPAEESGKVRIVITDVH
jgi:phenylacetate-coenzyme A ligase PaaK-like adenylate-forming protein